MAASTEANGPADAERAFHTHLGNHKHREILGFLSAAGEALTIMDLAELTSNKADAVTADVSTLLDVVVLVGHDGDQLVGWRSPVLAEAARSNFGDDLAEYAERIHRWWEAYQAQGWPQETPNYLLWNYPAQLVVRSELKRLAQITTDSARHDLMLTCAGTDMPALDEVTTALRQLADQDDPDLTTLAILVFERERLASRNHALPANLPATWARLGQPERARALAGSIPDILDKVHALSLLADATTSKDPVLAGLILDAAENAAGNAYARDADRARGALDLIQASRSAIARGKDLIWGDPRPPRARHQSPSISGLRLADVSHRLAALASALATVHEGHPGDLAAIMNDEDCARTLLARAGIRASRGSGPDTELITAAQRALGLVPEDDQDADVVALARLLAADGTSPPDNAAVLERACEVASTVTQELLRGAVIAGLARDLASVDPAKANPLAHEADEIVRGSGQPREYEAITLASMAVLLKADLPGQASRLAQEAVEAAAAFDVAALRSVTQAAVAMVLAGIYQELADGLIQQAEAGASDIEDSDPATGPGWVLQPVACACVAAMLARSDRERSHRLAAEAVRHIRRIARPSTRAQGLADVAVALTATYPELSEALARQAQDAARSVRECGFRYPVLARTAWALAAAGAEQDAEQQSEPDWKNNNSGHEGTVFECLIEGLAAAREFEAAERSARAARIALEVFPGTGLSKLAEGLARAGHYDRAEALSTSLGRFRPRILASIAAAMATEHHPQAAIKARASVQVARYHADSWANHIVFLEVSERLAVAFPDLAAELADEVCEDLTRSGQREFLDGYEYEYLARAARALALAGRWDDAYRVALGINSIKDKADAFAGIVIAAIAASEPERAAQAMQAMPSGGKAATSRIAASVAAAKAATSPDSSAQMADVAEQEARQSREPAWALVQSAEAFNQTLTALLPVVSPNLQQRARRMLGLALAEGDINWMLAMRELGRLAPGAIRAFYDKLLPLGMAGLSGDPASTGPPIDWPSLDNGSHSLESPGAEETQPEAPEHLTRGMSTEHGTDGAPEPVEIYCACGAVCEGTPSSDYPGSVGAVLLAWRQFRDHAHGATGPADAGTQIAVAGLLDQLRDQRETLTSQSLALLAALEISYAEMQGRITP